ncbi:MAG TPA: EamA family transporter [Patescibacteria group bacterium]|jgi:drug/metabolite transporter (DMT)-like permease
MVPIAPFIAVLSEVAGKTIDKLNFNRHKIGSNELIVLLFGTILAGILISLPVIRPPLPDVSLALGAALALMIVVSFGQNYFDFKGLSTTNLAIREPISNFQPILASFLAFAIFPSEREIKYVAAIVLGSFVLYWGNSNRRFRLQWNAGALYFLLAAVCSAILASIYKFGLETLDPFYLLLIRTVGILALAPLLMRQLGPRLRKLNRKQVGYGIAGGIAYLIGNLAEYYSIRDLGLNFTILILLLGPSLFYLSCALVLKERVTAKQVATSAALLAIIIAVSL